MSFDTDVPIDILVCYGAKRGTKFPHWMLVLVSQGRQRGTCYHSTGGPTQHAPYSVTIEANRKFDSAHGINKTERIATIRPNDVAKVKAAAEYVPAQQCQRYVVALVHRLEQEGLVPPGEAVRLNDKVQTSDRAQAYAQQDPVDYPPGAYVPVQKQTNNASPSRVQGSASNAYQAPPQPPAPKRKESKGCCLVM